MGIADLCCLLFFSPLFLLRFWFFFLMQFDYVWVTIKSWSLALQAPKRSGNAPVPAKKKRVSYFYFQICILFRRRCSRCIIRAFWLSYGGCYTGECCQSFVWEAPEAIRHWRSIASEEGSASVRQMAEGCPDSEAKKDFKAAVEGSSCSESVHSNIGQEPW